MKDWIKNHLPTRRRLIQLYAALLYNANLKGYISGQIYTGNTKSVCLPGLNCYSCPGAVGACPLGALQNALASSGNRAPYYMLGIILLLGLTLGRTICGYLCPMGLLQELLYKVPTPKVRKSRFTRILSYLKYVILLVFVLILPLWYMLQRYPVPAFCKYICPAGTFEGAIGLLSNPSNAANFSMLNILFTRKFAIMIVIFAACIFIYRAFCRFLCPLGAIYGFFSRVNLIGVKVEEPKCTHCDLCVGHCKMDIRHVGDHECIHCGGCIDACPTGAISFKAGKLTLRANATVEAPKRKQLRLRRGLAWCVALIVLAGALWYFNAPRNDAEDVAVTPVRTEEPTAEPTEEVPTDEPEVTETLAVTEEPTEAPVEESPVELPTGNEVGMIGPDFSAPLYGGGTFNLADTRGKVTVINFWATWCTPCCAELPHFDKLYQNYGDDIAIIALHSDLVTDDVDAYLAGFDYTIPFALDDSGVIAAYGGSVMLPQTIVLDKNGVITYNQVGSVTYELLESLVVPLI